MESTSLKGIVGVQEHGRLRLGVRGLEQVVDQPQPVADQLAAGGEIAHEVLVALLGDLRRGRDVDHEGDLALFADLGDRQRRAGIERADDAMRAGIDDALGLGTGDVDARFRVDIDQFDAHAEIGEHLRRHQRAAMTALARRREISGSRQQQADL
jgi:hypothetical protein